MCFLPPQPKKITRELMAREWSPFASFRHLTCSCHHDNASHNPNPANNVPNPTRSPRYATTWTPTRGKNTGVCSRERHQLMAHTPKNVPQKIWFDHEGGILAVSSSSAVGGSARGEVRYPADRSKTMPRDRNIDAMRSMHDTNTGTRCNRPQLTQDPNNRGKKSLQWREPRRALRAPRAL